MTAADLRDALLEAYDAVERPWNSESFAGLMDDLIAAATAEARAGLVEREMLAMVVDALNVWVERSHRVVDGRCPHREDGPCTSHRVVAAARAALAEPEP